MRAPKKRPATEVKPEERRLTWAAILLFSVVLLLTVVSGSSIPLGLFNVTCGSGFDAAALTERFLLLPVHLAFRIAPSTTHFALKNIPLGANNAHQVCT